MKKIPLLLVIVLMYNLIACTKSVDTTDTTTPTDTTTTTTTTPPTIKFFNVMDYGNVTIKLNGTSLGEVALYYPTNYLAGKIGTNRITVTFSGNTVVDEGVDLLANKNYSIFVYRVGYDWKLSLVTDDLTAPTAGYAKVRVLDFRTQAYFDYVRIKFSSLGSVDTLGYKFRNFLDHSTYDTYTTFKPLSAGSYNVVVFNDSTNLANKTNLPLVSGKIYTLLMETKASLTPAQAIYQIALDWKNNN